MERITFLSLVKFRGISFYKASREMYRFVVARTWFEIKNDNDCKNIVLFAGS